MTEDRMASVQDDEFDARLGRYLRWETGQVRGAPGEHDVAMRVAEGTAARRWAGHPVLVWAALMMALLVVVAVLLVAGNQDNKVVTASPDPSTVATPPASTSPTEGPTRAPITGAGPCRDGRIDIQSMETTTWRPDEGLLVAPPGGRIALALEEGASGGSIVVTDPSRDGLRVVATFTGEDIQSPGGVQVVSWSPSGDSLLVLAHHSSNPNHDLNCGDYFLLRADGSSIQRLTDHGPGEAPSGGAFSPSGTSVAYTLDSVLHIVTLAGGSRALPVPCLAIVGELRWTRDEQQILVQCDDGGLVFLDVAAGEWRWRPLDPGPLDARWTSGDQGIVVAVGDDVPGLTGGPLSILDVDPADLSFTLRVRSDVSTEWVVGVPSLSPDTRWLLVQGGGDVIDIPYYPTYLVDTATGVTTELPWPVMPDGVDDPMRRQPRVTWFLGNDRILTVQEGTLYEIDLRSITRRTVGTVPAEDYAWIASR